jgi:hypothetical protein
MPLRWKIAPLERMVVCVAEGDVTIDDLMAYFAAIEAAGASHYRKLLDATRGHNRLSEDDLAKIAAYSRSLGWRGDPGPMAVVIGAAGKDKLVADVRSMLRTGRRMRAFATIHEARQWLDSESLVRAA